MSRSRPSGSRSAGATRAGALPSALASVALAVGCAADAPPFDPFGPQPLAGAAQSAVKGRGNVFVTLDEAGIATVEGWVDDLLSEQAVLRTVARYPGVNGVIDRLGVEQRRR